MLLPTKKDYPTEINGFKLIKDFNQLRTINFYNSRLFESGRDTDFVKWRFYTKGFKSYQLYQYPDGDYFVVRTIKQKGLDILLLSDYRCNLESTKAFQNIYVTAKKIAEKKRIPFILCSSSHKTTDSVLEKKHAKSMGRPRPIILSKKFRDWIDKEKVDDRDFCFITFGDSDGEWNW